MTPSHPPRTARTLALVLAGVVVLSCLICGGVVWVFNIPLMNDRLPQYRPGLLTVADVERTWDLALPGVTATPLVDESGFQDVHTEVLLPLPSKDAFLRANRLTEGTGSASGMPFDADEEVRQHVKPKGSLRVVPLEGLTPRVADAGYVELYRHAALLLYDDQVWLYLVAFGT